MGRLVELNGVPIEDTYAEAFPAVAARLLITAATPEWARTAAVAFTGFATSVIGCGCEAAIEDGAPAIDTPDGRPGVHVLIFAMGRKGLADQVVRRVGQTVLTCATSACYDALEAGGRTAAAGSQSAGAGSVGGGGWIRVGGTLRFFGDGFQSSKRLEAALSPDGRARRLWRVPVMDGEFLVEHRFAVATAIAGGNFLVLGATPGSALAAAENAVAAMRRVPGIILPFPGGVVRSGSKVGSAYKFLKASTNTPYCPTIRGRVESALPEGTGAVYEIVIDGLTADAIAAAMRAGIRAACGPGVLKITAGNYGGRLGKHHFRLREILAS
jgi:formylmethanofuran--tetrahydromethanopterin N-formyltransferase